MEYAAQAVAAEIRYSTYGDPPTKVLDGCCRYPPMYSGFPARCLRSRLHGWTRQAVRLARRLLPHTYARWLSPTAYNHVTSMFDDYRIPSVFIARDCVARPHWLIEMSWLLDSFVAMVADFAPCGCHLFFRLIGQFGCGWAYGHMLAIS